MQLSWSYTEVFSCTGGTQTFPTPNVTFNCTCLSLYKPKQIGSVGEFRDDTIIILCLWVAQPQKAAGNVGVYAVFLAGQHQGKPG